MLARLLMLGVLLGLIYAPELEVEQQGRRRVRETGGPRAPVWEHVPTDAGAPPLRCAYMGFPSNGEVPFTFTDREMWFLMYLTEQATGRRLVFVNRTWPLEEQWATADVIIASGFFNDNPRLFPREIEVKLRPHTSHALVVWYLNENTLRERFFAYHSHFVNTVHASFGVRTDLSDANYLHLGGWMTWALDTQSGCTLPPVWSHKRATLKEANATYQAWRQRPGYASIVASHGVYPRPEICNHLNELGFGEVAGGGLWRRSASLPNATLGFNTSNDQKRAFIEGYRYNVCAESGMSVHGSLESGYITEKLVDALITGTVPVFWGDVAPPIFNEKRIVRVGEEELTLWDAGHAIRALETNATRAIEFFSEPLLVPGAQAWLYDYCAKAKRILARGWATVQRSRRLNESSLPADFGTYAFNDRWKTLRADE